MNRGSQQFILAMAFAAAAFSGSIAGVSSDGRDGTHGSKASATGGLTVKRGTATGNGAPGNRVTVHADVAPTGEKFARWTGDVAVLADPFSSTTSATVPFTAATITATYSSVTTTKPPPEHSGGGNVLPAAAKPNGYSLTDIAKATAFFSTSGPGGRSSANEPQVPFQILYTSDSNPSNTFSVRPGTTLYVPIAFADDSPPILGNFPTDVTDSAAVANYFFNPDELGAEFLEIIVDGQVTSIKEDSGYAVGVETPPLPDGGGTHYLTAAVFLTPFTKGSHTVTIRGRFTGAALGGGVFEFEDTYTVIVSN